MANTNTGIGRFGQTFLSKDFVDYAVNDELLINKTTGRIFYKNIVGEVIDIFDRYASNVSEARIDEIEAALARVLQTVSANGPAKTVHYKFLLISETEGQTDFEIPLVTFNKLTDFVILNINTTTPTEGIDYSIVNQRTIRLNGSLAVGTPIFVVVFKDIPQLDGNGEFSGSILQNESIPMEKLAPDVQRKIATGGSGGGQFMIVSETLPVTLPLGSMWIQAEGISPPLQSNEIIFATVPPANTKDGDMWFEIIDEGVE